ncbi:MAG: hypothetical protein JO097_14365 [Acidobacteriaceae bacterium]|nr:hypothetical protein [Acidobacteriaceae bacterium]MBV9765905.1 hypothetical protein [Acidobacteriaceae bacterium]
MKRRSFFVSLLTGCGSLMFPRTSRATLACGPFFPPGVQVCEAGINSTVANVNVASQHATEWCWAACIETIFRYYRHAIPQERIVAETWGAIVNLPGQPLQIVADLNRQWTDEDGNKFQVRGDVFSANAITAAQDLAGDMPLIIGSMGHAMVLTSLQYVRDAYGNGSVRAATVRDPWPGRGRRILSPQEWLSTNFLARIRVS